MASSEFVAYNEVVVVDYTTEVQTFTEELFNTITHACGLLLSIPAAILLVSLARRHGNKWHVYGCGLYAASLVIMYTCSTLYHYSGIADAYLTPETLRNLDHCAVFFLIAGTYTPLTLIGVIYNNTYNPNNLRAGKSQLEAANKSVKLGWIILIVIWSMCIVGVSAKLILGTDGLPPSIFYSFYMIMGWTAAFASSTFLKYLPKTCLRLLVAGGLFYSVGIFFLLYDRLPFNHPVWHLFVGAGSVFHYFSVISCAIPIADVNVWKKMENKTRSKLLDQFTRFAYTNFCKNI